MTVEITRTQKIEVETPEVPDKLKVVGNQRVSMDIADLTQADAENVVDEWALAFHQRRNARLEAREAPSQPE